MTDSKKKVLAIGMALLGIAMIVFGAVIAPKLMIPPIITGVGFLLIAWAHS